MQVDQRLPIKRGPTLIVNCWSWVGERRDGVEATEGSSPITKEGVGALLVEGEGTGIECVGIVVDGGVGEDIGVCFLNDAFNTQSGTIKIASSLPWIRLDSSVMKRPRGNDSVHFEER